MIAELPLEHPAARDVVVELPAQVRVPFEPDVARGSDADLANLRELVRREHRRGFGSRGRDLPAQARLALDGIPYRRVFAHGLHQPGDHRAEAHAQLDRRRVRAFEDVVEKARGHDPLGVAEHVQQRPDLERVEEERRRVGLAQLPGVTLGRELEGLRRKGEVVEVGGPAHRGRNALDRGRGHAC